MFHRFDLWFGKRLFIPIAIRLCQLLGISQYALHTYLWLSVILWNMSRGPHALGGYFMYTLMAILAVVWVCISALTPDAMRRPATFIRHLWICIFFLDIGLFMGGVYFAQSLLSSSIELVKDWMILLAEYAITIHTIPPLESREKKRAAKLARQNA